MTSPQRLYLQTQIKRSNWRPVAEAHVIYHPGHNIPCQSLSFRDAFKARQLHILWLI